MTQTAEGNKRKGFATFSPEKRREVASRGGKAAHMRGTAHEWTHDEAVRAGQLGAKRKRERREQEAVRKAAPALQYHLTRFWLEIWRIASLTRLYMTERGMSEQEAMEALMSLADVSMMY